MRGQSGYGTPDYKILFVDPKGMSQSAYQYKIDGYHRLFLDERTGQPRAIRYNGMQVRVALAMYANALHVYARGLKDQIVAALDQAALDAIDIENGWPV